MLSSGMRREHTIHDFPNGFDLIHFDQGPTRQLHGDRRFPPGRGDLHREKGRRHAPRIEAPVIASRPLGL